MPTSKSAKKRMRTSAENRLRNSGVKSRVATAKKKLVDAIAKGDKAEAEKQSRAYCSCVDKAAKQGVLKANAASRRKSNVAKKLAAM